jgi:hypothetical protein
MFSGYMTLQPDKGGGMRVDPEIQSVMVGGISSNLEDVKRRNKIANKFRFLGRNGLSISWLVRHVIIIQGR